MSENGRKLHAFKFMMVIQTVKLNSFECFRNISEIISQSYRVKHSGIVGRA